MIIIVSDKELGLVEDSEILVVSSLLEATKVIGHISNLIYRSSKEDTKDFLEKYLVLLEKNKENLYNVSTVEEITKPFINDNGLKFPQLFQPIRIALTGGTQAPSVYDIISILGFNEVSSRLSEALKRNFQNT